MAHEAPTVFLVDDDIGVLKALTRLVRAAGYAAQPCASVEGFLRTLRPETPGGAYLDPEAAAEAAAAVANQGR